MEQLSPAEVALLSFWHSYVPGFSPNKRQYTAAVHTIANRTMVYYFMTEELIAYFQKCGIQGAVGYALDLMGVRSSTLAEWRRKWGREWRNLHLNEP